MSVSAIGRAAGKDRRTVQRSFIPLEHCGFVRRSQVNGCAARIELMIHGRVAL